MKVIQAIIGLFFIAAGIAGGIYVGLVHLFVGGIIEVVHGAQAHPADTGAVVWGVVKALILASPTGALIFWLGAALGGVFLKTANEDRYAAAIKDIGRTERPMPQRDARRVGGRW